MAAKKQTIVAFALRDHTEGEGDDALTLIKGQRIELAKTEFAKLKKKGAVVEGVYVHIKTAIEGKRYSLKRHSKTWLAPDVYEAWKAAGYCEPTDDDPEVEALLKAREEAMNEAIADRNAALSKCAELEAQLQEAKLHLYAARDQAEKVREMIEPFPSGGGGGGDADSLPREVEILIDLFPEPEPEPDPNPKGDGEGAPDPELKLG